jgi:hypothetical protein
LLAGCRIVDHDQFRAKSLGKLFGWRLDGFRWRGCAGNRRWWNVELGRIRFFGRRGRRRWRRNLDNLRCRRFRLRLALPHERWRTERRGGELLVAIEHIANRRLPVDENQIAGDEA